MRIPEGVNFSDYINIVGELEAQEIHSAGYWRDKLLERAKGPKIWGDKLPWGKTHNHFRLRPGELTVWAGINGHKKSLLLGQVMLNLAGSRKIAIASLEMYPEETLFRMCMQASGVRDGTLSPAYIKEFTRYADRNVLIYDQLDTVPTEKILGFVHYCAKELGCEHIVLDSLSKCGIKNDMDAEAEFINRLQWAAKNLRCHVHLVHHVKKPQHSNKYYRPNKFDVKGNGALTDMADNVIIVWKNIRREEELEKKSEGFSYDTELVLNTCDQELIVEKQRHGQWEGYFKLWFHPSGQFLAADGNSIPVNLAEAA